MGLMHPTETYKSFCLLALFILSVGLAFLIVKWPQGRHATFSQHAAAQKQSIIYNIALYTVVLPIFYLFFVGWFKPTFRLSVWFDIFIVGSLATQYICTLIPETGGRKSTLHRFFAFLSADFLVPAILLIGLSDKIDTVARVMAFLALTIMSFIIVYLASVKVKHKNLLLLQTGYFVSFFIAVLAATYFSS